MEPKPREVRLYEDASGRCPFDLWLMGLRDSNARAIVRERIARLSLGNFGDSRGVGAGVAEARIPYGPGYRLYFAGDGDTIVVLLCGGMKRTQRADIARAKEYWADYRRLVEDAQRVSRLPGKSEDGPRRS